MLRTERQVDRLGFFVQNKSGQVTAMGFSKVQAAVILLISQLKKKPFASSAQSTMNNKVKNPSLIGCDHIRVLLREIILHPISF
jgi:hypothetical protein